MTEERQPDRRAGRARAAALAAALAALVGAGEAAADDVPAPELATSGSPAAALEQAAEQTSQTLQAAGSEAAAAQEGATNVALPTVEASPGAETVVAQANDANAVSEAANGAETTLVAAQDQQGGPAAAPDLPAPSEVDEMPAEGDEAPADLDQTPAPVSEAAAQGSTTTQVAGAQATTVQTQPVNVAVPIVIASPGANTVVIQTNSASAGAQATNTAATTQAAGQTQSGDKPAADAPQGQPPPPQTGLPGSGPGGSGIDLVLDGFVQTGSATYIWIWDWTWNWDWDWDWSTGGIDLPPVPSLPPVPGWTPPGDEADPVRPPEQAKGPRNGVNGASPQSLVAPRTPAYESLPPGPLASASREAKRPSEASSIFVQRDPAPDSGRLFPPIGRYGAPGGSAGAGIAPLTLVVGALLALALQIFSAAGLLGRRFALTSVGWRRQAYLTPLERPG